MESQPSRMFVDRAAPLVDQDWLDSRPSVQQSFSSYCFGGENHAEHE
jgi:hypothetical protein